MWEINAGINMVRVLQEPVRAYNYHIAIGGGVINKGFSEKDLDLYFLPMGGFNKDRKSDPDGLIKFLEALWNTKAKSLGEDYGYDEKNEHSIYKKAVKFMRGSERIDCFVF